MVESAPEKYASDVATLLLYYCDEEPSGLLVQSKLLEMIEDTRPAHKQPSFITEFAAAMVMCAHYYSACPKVGANLNPKPDRHHQTAAEAHHMAWQRVLDHEAAALAAATIPM